MRRPRCVTVGVDLPRKLCVDDYSLMSIVVIQSLTVKHLNLTSRLTLV